LIDKNGVYYFTINPEVTSLFSEEEILSAVDYDSIIFPPVKM
jgi:hypothetical protein